MKKYLLVALTGLIGFQDVKAQAFEEGNSVVSVGYGLGLGYGRLLNAYSAYDGYKFSGFGPVALGYEYGLTDNIGLGLNVSYSSYGATWIQSSAYDPFNVTEYDYKYRWSTLAIMARGAYHFDIRNDDLDLYAGLGLGFLKFGYKWTSDDPTFNEENQNVSLGTPLGYQIFGGLRYYLSDNVGLYAEVGYGISVLNAGLAFKF
jgi:opacity protein-like surface antigen